MQKTNVKIKPEHDALPRPVLTRFHRERRHRVLDTIRPTPNVVWFPDPQQWDKNGLAEFCEIWPQACRLERVELFGELSRPQDIGNLGGCRPAALYGRSNIYLLGCEPPGFMEEVYAPPPIDPQPIDPPLVVTPEPRYLLAFVVALGCVACARQQSRHETRPRAGRPSEQFEGTGRWVLRGSPLR